MVVLALIALLSTCAASAAGYRAFWVTGWSSGFLKQSEVDKLLGVPGNATSKGDIRNANCNAVVVQVRRRADVCYPSAMGEPYFSGLTPADFNALQAIINAAHDTTGGKKRIEVHCWIVVFRTDGNSVYAAHSDTSNPANYWPTLDAAGNETEDQAFDPGHPNCEEYLVNVCMDLVNNFDIDGLNFDYIRFTGADQGYNPTSIARYNARYGLSGQPADNEQFKQWRRDQVTAFVRKVYAKIQASKPTVKLSGCFIGGTPSPTSSTREAFLSSSAYSRCYSDWDSWMQEGIVDIAFPMTYFDNVSRPTDYINWMNFDKDRKANRFMVIGPGIYLNYLDDAISQILATRDASTAGNYADGFCGYSYQAPYCTNKTTDTYGSWLTFSARLLTDVTPTWADVPTMPWKTSPTKGHIGGTVRYPTSTWADGAYVRLTGPESRTMWCDGTGFYAFIDLAPGAYTVRVNYGQYQQQRAISVTAGAIANGDFSLSTVDTTAPIVSDLQVTNISDGGATVTWATEEPAKSQVEYDSVPYFGQSTAEHPALLTEHGVTLTGLTPNTTYSLRAKSRNGAGLAGYSGEFSFTTLPVTTDVIVDELDSGCSLVGSWIVGGSSGGWDGGYKYISCTNGTPTATATWTPTLLRSGLYDVSTYYREGANRPDDAHFTVNHAGGSVNVFINQQVGRYWVPLATGVPFEMGTSGNVVVNNQTANTLSKNVIADAVKFEYKGDITPPVMSSVTDDQYTTSTTTLHASWSGTDAESGVTGFRCAVGTQPMMADVKPWTDAGTATSADIGGLSLAVGQKYYISVRAVNSAGLTSNPLSSAGVTVAQAVASVSAARELTDGQPVCLAAPVVTAKFASMFYVEDANRVSGMRVDSTGNVAVGSTAQVFGVLSTIDGCERTLVDCRVIPGSATTPIRPFAIGGRSLGGTGLNNLGLLVRAWGRVVAVDSAATPTWFEIEDGSGARVRCVVPTGVTINRAWNYVLVTGISSCEMSGSTVTRLLRVRTQSDIQTVN